MTCAGCGAPLVRPATPGVPLMGIVIHVKHRRDEIQLCPGPNCGGWDVQKEEKE